VELACSAALRNIPFSLCFARLLFRVVSRVRGEFRGKDGQATLPAVNEQRQPLLFARDVTQVGPEFHGLSHLRLNRRVEPFHDRVRFGLSERVLQHFLE
jgi:hypothetical protein